MKPTILSGPPTALIAIAVIAASAFTQPAARLRFEVASVKPAGEPAARMRAVRPLPNGRFIARNATLKMLILNAYTVQPYQLAGGPSWLDSDGFDIDAKGGANTTRAQELLMLQALLEDRFQLRYRRAHRDLPVYALVIARHGAKLAAPQPDGCLTADPNTRIPPAAAPSGTPPPVPCGAPRIDMKPEAIELIGNQVTVSALARILEMVLGRPVIDRTGIARRFDLDLTFARDELTAGLPRPMSAALPQPAEGAPLGDSLTAPPSILAAIRQQLGLKLESTRGPVEVMIVDRVERPAEN